MGAADNFLENYIRNFPRIIFRGRVDAAYACPTGSPLSTSNPYTRTGDVITASGNGAFPSWNSLSIGEGAEVMLWQEADPTDNGVYLITDIGSGGTPFELTRTWRTDGQNPYGYAWACYPWLGTEWGTDAGVPRLFVCTTDGAVNTDGLTWVPTPFSTFPAMYDASNDLTLWLVSGQRILIPVRDDILIQGGDLTQSSNLSATIPATGVWFFPATVQNRQGSSNDNLTQTYRDAYINFGSAASGTEHDIDFALPNGSVVEAYSIAFTGFSGATNFSFGWDDAPTTFVNDQTVGQQSGITNVTRTGGVGNFRLTFNTSPTAGTVKVCVWWRQLTATSDVFFNT